MRARARAHVVVQWWQSILCEEKPLAAIICDNNVQWECDLIILASYVTDFFFS